MSLSRSVRRSVPSALFLICLTCGVATAQDMDSAEPQTIARAALAKPFDLTTRLQLRTEARAEQDYDHRQLFSHATNSPDWTRWQDPNQTPPPQVNTRTPLTPGEKMERAFKNAFLSPYGYISTAVGAAITEAREDDLPHKETDDRIADFGSRFAIRFATRSTRTIFVSGIYPVLFKQDPRYRPAGKKPFFERAAHAASRVFVTDDDDGNLEPNYSFFAGAFTASALANIWEQSTPGHDRIGTDATLRRFAYSFPSAMINNILIREFLPDLIKKIRK